MRRVQYKLILLNLHLLKELQLKKKILLAESNKMIKDRQEGKICNIPKYHSSSFQIYFIHFFNS